jgi:hypothetical protein
VVSGLIEIVVQRIELGMDEDLLSTSFFVYVSVDLWSWINCTTLSRSSSLSFCRPSASFSMSTCCLYAVSPADWSTALVDDLRSYLAASFSRPSSHLHQLSRRSPRQAQVRSHAVMLGGLASGS